MLKHATLTMLLCALLAAMPAPVQADQTQGQTRTQALSDRQKSIIVISAFTASGDLARLKPALVQGLEAGLTVNEIKEILVQLYAYTGFPRSLNAINTFMTLMDERQKNGITDEMGREASPMPGLLPTFLTASGLPSCLPTHAAVSMAGRLPWRDPNLYGQ